MLKAMREGYTIKFDLPSYKNYSVKCLYKYHKQKGQYSLSMWITRKDVDDDFKIDYQEIDTQYIPGTRETIEKNISIIVEEMDKSRYFDFYVERFEYTCKCFDKGNDFFEHEELNTIDD